MEKNQNKIQQYFFLILFIGAILLMFYLIRPFLSSLVLAVSLAAVFRPIYRRLLQNVKGRKGIAAFLTIFIIVIVVLIPLILLGGLLLSEASTLYASLTLNGGSFGTLTHSIDSTEVYLQQFIPGISINVAHAAQYGLSWTLQHLNTFFSGFLNVLLGTFITLISLFYILKDGGRLKQNFILLSPLRNSYDEQIIEKISAAINSVIKGSLMIALVQGIIAALGMWLFGVGNPILLGALATVASLIPGLGTAVIVIPAILYLFFSGHTGSAIGLIVWGLAVVGLVDNFLNPYLLNRGMKLHPLFILISVLGGISLFGPIGFLLGPIILAFFFALLDIYPLIIKQHDA